MLTIEREERRPRRTDRSFARTSSKKGFSLERLRLQDENVGNIVYITYDVRPDNKGSRLPWSLKETFYYDILVKSDATVLLHYAGPVAVVDIPKKGLIIDFDGHWNEMVSHVDQIPAAFAKDVETRK